MRIRTPVTVSEFALVRYAAKKTHMTEAEFSRIAVAWLAREVAELGELVVGPSRIAAIRSMAETRRQRPLVSAATRALTKELGFYTSAEFAVAIGRHKQWVTDRCAARVIKTLPGGKPWRIPLTELARWNEA